MKILSTANGLAQLDIDGSGQAATPGQLSQLGVVDAERAKLAELYQPGKTLWRVPVRHFSPWDVNWGLALPPGATSPDFNQPVSTVVLPKPCTSSGSIIECENQTLGEQKDINGTDLHLNYRSDRVPGRQDQFTLRIPLAGSNPPAELSRIDLEIEVAGRKFESSFQAGPDKTHTFTWDGRDAFGRLVQGEQPVTVRVGWVYPGTYTNTEVFGVPGDGVEIGGDRGRGEITLWREYHSTLGTWDARAAGLGGWTLDVQHAYDPAGQTLFTGEGTRRDARDLHAVITSVAGRQQGDEVPFADGVKANQSPLNGPGHTAVGPDGSIYIPEFYTDRVRKIGPDGNITTVAGSGDPASAWEQGGFGGDGGSATTAQLDGPAAVAVGPDGSLYIADSLNNRVRRVDPQGTITTVVGDGRSCGFVDGSNATATPICHPSDIEVGPDGAIYIATWEGVLRVAPDGVTRRLGGDGYRIQGLALAPDGSVYYGGILNPVVRHWRPSGQVETVAGTGEYGYSGDGGPATEAKIDAPQDLTVAPDGSLYLVGGNRVRRITADGVISTVAGTGADAFGGDGGPAARAQLNRPTAISFAPNGDAYLSEGGSNRLRRLGTVFPSFTGSAIAIPSENGKELYEFDARGRHLRTMDTLTGATVYRFAYDASGRLTRVTDGDGNQTQIERGGDGAPSAIVAPFGQRTGLDINSDGYLASMRDPGLPAATFDYYGDGLLKALTTPRGNTNHFSYDPLGRLSKDDDPLGGSKAYTRTSTSDTTHVHETTALGRTNDYDVQYLADGSLQRAVTNSAGVQSGFTDRVDGTSTKTFRNGTRIDESKMPDPRFGMQAPLLGSEAIRTPDGPLHSVTNDVTASLRDPSDPLTLKSLSATTTVNGRPYHGSYTALGRRWSLQTPTGRASLIGLDGLERAVFDHEPGIQPVSYSYDTRGRLTAIRQGTRQWQLTYDAGGRLSSIIDPVNLTYGVRRDAAGRVTTRILPGGREVGIGYDADGNITSITPPGRNAYSFAPDARRQVRSETAPDAGTGDTTTQYDYNLDRQLTKITRADGQVVDLTYDPSGRLARVGDQLTGTRYTYDSATGSLRSIISGNGETVNVGEDGWLPTEYRFGGPVAGSTSATWDDNLRPTSTSVNGSATAGLFYNGDGLLIGAGNLSITRDPISGLETGTSLDSTTTNRSTNAFGEPEGFTASGPSGGLFGESYQRDAAGRITQRTENVGATAHTFGYAYDASGRLADVTRDGQSVAHYEYDANGNRQSEATGGQLPVTATYDAQDRLSRYGSTTYTYGPDGELRTASGSSTGGSTTYFHDALDRLTGVTLPSGVRIQYVLDGDGRRVGKKVDGNLVEGFLYGPDLGPLAQLDGNGNVVSRFVYGTKGNVPDYMVRDGQTYRIISDSLGSPRLVVNSQTGEIAEAIDYDPYGRVLSDTHPGFQPFGYAGGLYDRDTKLTHFNARDYDAATGRWTTKDPLGFGAGDPNLYGYVLQDPINWLDPSGLQAQVSGPQMPITGTTCGWNVYTRDDNGGWQANPGDSHDGLPRYGEPNSSAAKDNGQGKGQIRDYGPNGEPLTDYDFGDPHGGRVPDPHAHDWDNSAYPPVRGPPRQIHDGEFPPSGPAPSSRP